MVALLWTVCIAICCAANMACIVEADAEVPTTKAAGRSRLLLLARIHTNHYRYLGRAHY